MEENKYVYEPVPTIPKENPEDESRLRKWCRSITVEPAMFLYMLAFMTTSVVEQAFFVDKACRVNHGFQTEICDNINDKNNSVAKKQVQLTVSTFHQWNSIAGHLVPIVLALFMGAWSDRRGRKLPLIIGLSGSLVYSIMLIINSLESTWPLEFVIYTATIPMAFSGADVIIFAAAFSYISDVTTVADRTIRITILHVCYLSTMPTGVAIGNYLFKLTGRSFSTMFTINAALLTLSIIYVFLNLEWRTTDRQKPLTGGISSWFADFFDRDHVAESLSTVWKKRSNHRTVYLIMLFVIMALYTFQRDENRMSYLYFQKELDWSVDQFSNFKTFQSALFVSVMLLGTPVMSRWLGLKDSIIIMIGAVSNCIGRVCFATATDYWLVYIGGTVSSFGPLMAPVLRSMTSKIVSISERGKIFSLMSVADNAIPLLSGVLYSKLYTATIDTHPESIFWLTFSTQAAIFTFMLVIFITASEDGLIHKEVEVTEKNLNPEKINNPS